MIGLDVEPSLIAEADKAMSDIPARSWRGIVSDCDPIPLPDGIASVVLCTEVLEHVPDPARLAAELGGSAVPERVTWFPCPIQSPKD